MKNKSIIVGALVGALALFPAYIIGFGWMSGDLLFYSVFMILEIIIGLLIGAFLGFVWKKNKIIFVTTLIGAIIGLIVGSGAFFVNIPIPSWIWYVLSLPTSWFYPLLTALSGLIGEEIGMFLGLLLSTPLMIISGMIYGVIVGLIIKKIRKNIINN
ncbi:MAG TPA: hypothetical protein P5328_01325 [Candidatus Paceibacterota bacterium]|nr:hypothetical protein [Candidatus Paceibacterota bacterium]HRZ34721.1 hypothetical protein [Candidatus Paceibacterota bacterium]